VNSVGNSIAGLSNSAGNLINRSPEPQVGVSTILMTGCPNVKLINRSQAGAGDVLAGTAQGSNTLLSGGTNNAVNSAGNSAADVSNSAGDLVN
jgi:hypothetical protein